MNTPEFLHDYSFVPEELIAALRSSGIAPYASCGDIPICSTDESDCSSDGGACSDYPCKDSPCRDTCKDTCKFDSPCSTDGICGADTPCSDTPAAPPTTYGSITIVSTTSTSVTLQLSSISKATSYVVAYRKSSVTSASMYPTTSLSVTISGLTPNTEYIFNYYGLNDDGTGPYMPSGVSATTQLSRPANWEWWSTVRSGAEINLSASEWNAFCVRINEFRQYTGYPTYGAFSSVSRGSPISATIVNHAVWAISAMKPPTSPPSDVYTGDVIGASFFNGLKYALNSIQ